MKPSKTTIAQSFILAITMCTAIACGNNDENNSNNANNSNNTKMDMTQMDMSNDMKSGDMTSNDMSNNDMPNDQSTTDMATDMADMSQDQGGDMSQLTPAEAFNAYNTELRNALCERVFQCPEKAAFFNFLFGRYASEQDCKDSGFSFVDPSDVEEVTNAVNAGRITFDVAAANTCLNDLKTKLAAGRCATKFDGDLPSSCANAFKGKVEIGNVCVTDESCGENAYCDIADTGCTGTCKAHQMDGQTCVDEECLEGSSCNDGTCVKKGSVADGASCTEDEQCGNTSNCSEGVCTTISDATIANMGESCGLGGAPPLCKPGLVCTDINFMTGTGTCGTPKAAGGDCYLFAECGPNLRCEGANVGTRTPGKCVAVGGVGATCDTALIDCQTGLTCVNDQCAQPMACPFPTR